MYMVLMVARLTTVQPLILPMPMELMAAQPTLMMVRGLHMEHTVAQLPGTTALESLMARTAARLPGVMVTEPQLGLTAIQPPGTGERFTSFWHRKPDTGDIP